MGHQFVGLFRGRIQAHRVIHLILCGIRDLFVGSVNTGAGCIYQVLHGMMTAGLQNIIESDDVGFHVHIRMIDRITNTGLGRQIDDHIKMMLFKEPVHQRFIGNAAAHEAPRHLGILPRRLFDLPQTVLLQGYIIVVVHVIQPDHRDIFSAFQQPQNQVRTDKTHGSGDENILSCKHSSYHTSVISIFSHSA